MRGAYVAGLALGFPNAIRHRLRGYRTPRPRAVDAHDHAQKVVSRWLGHVNPRGLRVLEVGPGADLLTGELLLAAGATSYTAVDAFRLAEPRSGMEYIVTDFPALPRLVGDFDLIVSNATLEHLDDVDATFQRLTEVSATNAVWCHYIDAKTHMRWIRDRDPLNLLRYPEQIYRLMSFPGIPNRLRASDYVRAAEASGLRATVTPGKVAEATYIQQLRTYRDYEQDDLHLLTFMLVCRKQS